MRNSYKYMGFFDSIGDMEFGKSYYELAGLIKDEVKDAIEDKKAQISESQQESKSMLESFKDNIFLG